MAIFGVLFIALAIFCWKGLWQEEPPDHSKVHDTFLVHIESNEEESNNLKSTTGYIKEGDAYTDSLYHLDERKFKSYSLQKL